MFAFKIKIVFWALYLSLDTVFFSLFASLFYCGMVFFFVLFLVYEQKEVKASLGLKAGVAGMAAHWLGALIIYIGSGVLPIIVFSIIFSGLIIFIFNLTQLQKIIGDMRKSAKVAIIQAIASAPWLFFVNLEI